MIDVETSAGRTAVVVEVKYADRFNSRSINVDSVFYRELVDNSSVWKEGSGILRDQHLNQLLRCHALGIVGHEGYTIAPKLLVVHHADDQKALEIFSAYEEELADKKAANSISINDLIELMERTAVGPEQRGIVEGLKGRYASESRSEELWCSYLGTLG